MTALWTRLGSWLLVLLVLLVLLGRSAWAQPAAPSTDAAALLKQGIDRLQAGEVLAALGPLTRARELFVAQGNAQGIGLSWLSLGKAQEALGQGSAALDCYGSAAAATTGKLPAIEVAARVLAAGIRKQAGDQAGGLAELARVRAIISSVADRATAAQLLVGAGNLFDDTQEGAAHALPFYQQAQRAYHELPDRPQEARVMLSLGQVYLTLRQPKNAMDLYQGAEQLMQDLKTPAERRLLARAYQGRGRTYLALESLGKAQEYFSRAQELWEELHDQGALVTVLGQRAAIDLRTGWYDDATDEAKRALTLYEAAQDQSGQAWMRELLGSVALNTGDYAAALAAFTQARELRRRLRDRRSEAWCISHLAKTLEAKGRPAEALRTYIEALTVFEDLRADARVAEATIPLQAEVAPVYQRAVELALRSPQPGQDRLAFALSERARARAFLDQAATVQPRNAGAREVGFDQLRRQIDALEREVATTAATAPAAEQQARADELRRKQRTYSRELAELRLQNSDYLALRTVSPLSLEQVQAGLPADAALLSYFVMPSATAVFVVTRTSFVARLLAVKETDLGEAVKDFHDFSSLEDEVPTSLVKLHGWLLQPIAAELPPVQTLVVAAHGVLNYLPFAALSDGQQFLGERFTIRNLPSASAVRRAAGSGLAGALQGRRLLALVPAVNNLAPLPHALAAAQRIVKLYEGELDSGATATRAALQRRAGEFNLLLLSAHGRFDPEAPLFSRIFLAPQGDSDGLLYAHEVYDLPLRQMELVVLSGCQTQLGEHSDGDDVTGLARAFLYAGSRSVMASLWKVGDQATEQLMTEFFRLLQGGMDPARALRAAQAEVRKTRRHPWYWAAFVLTG